MRKRDAGLESGLESNSPTTLALLLSVASEDSDC